MVAAERTMKKGQSMHATEKYILDKARRHWAALMKTLGSPGQSEQALDDLLARCSEPHRAYHTLAHIVAMLDELEQTGERDPAIALAVWYHDAVYDTHEHDNEMQSASLARDAVGILGLPESLGVRVSGLVLATKHTAPPTDPAAQLLVDLDLMILGKPEAEFDAYEAGVRAEYVWVPEPDFRAARVRILQPFLDRPMIFSTARFRDAYEVAARKNLERSIAQLL